MNANACQAAWVSGNLTGAAPSLLPDLQFKHPSNLYNLAQVTSSMHICCDSAQPWGLPEEGLPHFGKLPG